MVQCISDADRQHGVRTLIKMCSHTNQEVGGRDRNEHDVRGGFSPTMSLKSKWLPEITQKASLPPSIRCYSETQRVGRI